MNAGQPSPAEERWLALAARLPGRRQAPLFAARSGDWRSVGVWTRCAFFCLGLLATGLTLSLLSLLHVPRSLLVTGFALVAVTEWIIWRRRLAAAGIEEALEVQVSTTGIVVQANPRLAVRVAVGVGASHEMETEACAERPPG